MIASDWCLDVWRPIDDLTMNEMLSRITPDQRELEAGISREHLIDDYTTARNIARFGLKYKSFLDIYKLLGVDGLIQHKYLESVKEKVDFLEK